MSVVWPVRRSNAVMSTCGQYRYTLVRTWNLTWGRLCFLLLNPSTADHAYDDPTIRRCLGFARAWGYGALQVVTLFAYRATQPQRLREVPDPVGPDNDRWILDAAAQSYTIIAGWGLHGRWHSRDTAVLALLHGKGYPVYHLGLTQDGSPRHPLYLRADVEPALYEGRTRP